MQNRSKEYSIAVIMHALKKNEYEGNKQEYIAGVLGGIDPSNITKYKKGDSVLSATKINLLIERFGCPRQASGVYLEAKCYNELESFKNEFNNRHIDSFRVALTTLFSNEYIQHYLAWAITDNVIRPPEQVERFFHDGCYSEDIPKVINWLADASSSDWFREWTDETIARIKVNTKHDLPDIRGGNWNHVGIGTNNEKIMLSLLGYFLTLDPEFDFKPSNTVSNLKGLSEVVVTGDEILTFESDSCIGISESLFPLTGKGKLLPLNDLGAYRLTTPYDYGVGDRKIDPKIEGQIKQINEFGFKGATVSLYLNDKMEYRLVVRENWGISETVSVITHVRQDLIIDLYREISVFYKLEPKSERVLKEKIAINGGFIPGALVY